MIRTLLKNFMYLLVGLLGVTATGMIARVLNKLLAENPNTLTIIIATVYLTLVCKWVGKQLLG